MTESFVESTSANEFCIGRGISLCALSNIERPIAGTRASMSLNTNGSFEPCDLGYSRSSTFLMAAPLLVKFIRILSFSRETIFSGIFSSGANGDCFCAWIAGVDFSCGAESFAVCSARAARAYFSAAASFVDESYIKYIAANRRITPIMVFFLSIFSVSRAKTRGALYKFIFGSF